MDKRTAKAWWLESEPHKVLNSLAKDVWDASSQRVDAIREAWSLYGDTLEGLDGLPKLSPIFVDEMSENQLANTLETLHAGVFKNKIIPSPCTVDGDWGQQQRAKELGRFLGGVYEDNKIHGEVVPLFGMDTLIAGTGVLFVSHEMTDENDAEARVVVERQNPIHLATDLMESRNGKPRSLYRRSFVDRWTLLERVSQAGEGYVGSKEARRKAVLDETGWDEQTSTNSSFSDSLCVYEAWHLPSGPKAKDGMYVMYLRSATLVKLPYTRTRFPFAFARNGFTAAGFWGRSAVDRLAPCQRNLDKLAKRIERSHDLLGVPRLLVKAGEVVKAQIDNEIGSIIEYEGSPPTEWNATPIHPAAYQERDGLPQRMRSLVGVSQFEATQQLPAQLREASGAAMERWQDSGTDRQAMVHRRYESAMVELADVILDECEELDSRGVRVQVSAPGDTKGSIRIVDFKKCKVDRRFMKLRILPMSQLPHSFSGRVSELSRLKEAGVIDERTFRALLEVPDIESENDLISSPVEVIRKTLTKIVEEGIYYEPLGLDDLDVAKKTALGFFNLYRIRSDADDERLGLLARYIQDCDALLNPPAQPVDPLAPPMPGAPPPMPGPAPPPPGPMMPPQGPAPMMPPTGAPQAPMPPMPQ